MKRKLKVLLLVLTLTSLVINLVNFTVTPDLFIRINETEIEPWFHAYAYATDVFFPVKVEIWNPSLFPVVIQTGNWDLLDPGENIIFENQSLTYSSHNIELPATNTHYVKPGITHLNYSFFFLIYGVNVTSLPLGNYELWGKIDAFFNKIKSLKLYIEVNSTGYFFSSDKLPWDWGRFRLIASDWDFLTFSFVLISAGWLGYRVYYKKNTTKTYN